MPFLFTKSMAERALSIVDDFFPTTEYESQKAVDRSIKAYDYFCQQYGGLGFLGSFLPWTQAFKARMLLSDDVDKLSKQLREDLKDDSSFLWRSKRLALYGPILGSILSWPFKLLHEASVRPFEFYNENKKRPIRKLFRTLPILSDFYTKDSNKEGNIKKEGYKKDSRKAELLHTLCNPMRLLEDSLTFLHEGLNRLIEIGSERGREPGPGRKFFKGLVGVLFTFINIPVKIVSTITDLPYQVVKNGIYEPLKFIGTSWENGWNNRNKKEDGVIIKSEDVPTVRRLLQRGSTSNIMQHSANHTGLDSSVRKVVDVDLRQAPPFQQKAMGVLSGEGSTTNGFVVFKSTKEEVRQMKGLVKEARREAKAQLH